MKKTIAVIAVAMLLVVGSVLGTLAYLTSTDSVENTFTVGKVAITLDEAKVDANGAALTGEQAERVKANSYKLMPGHTYDKDPQVTVKAGSELSYIKLVVTIEGANDADALFKANNIAINSVVTGLDNNTWVLKSNTVDRETSIRTYEFWYKDAVSASNADVKLPALFSKITVPGTITNAQLETISNLKIKVTAYAIQADGFTDATAAWAAYSK